ncbi:hypothetical protein F383_33605 [Gossypium arboreum]|uniref:Uncharacterized protein n=1 Tax=Gossypium arboreum TaxID=29729 RepID=A0A0B0PMY6_GOSAR|nr:hypothetical protein F383_33605 [Gossypium arboreum]
MANVMNMNMYICGKAEWLMRNVYEMDMW